MSRGPGGQRPPPAALLVPQMQAEGAHLCPQGHHPSKTCILSSLVPHLLCLSEISCLEDRASLWFGDPLLGCDERPSIRLAVCPQRASEIWYPHGAYLAAVLQGPGGTHGRKPLFPERAFGIGLWGLAELLYVVRRTR